MSKIYSFDVFDTCITRTYTRPDDVFYEIADRFLKNNCPNGYDNNTIVFFLKLRRFAEKNARRFNVLKI